MLFSLTNQSAFRSGQGLQFNTPFAPKLTVEREQRLGWAIQPSALYHVTTLSAHTCMQRIGVRQQTGSEWLVHVASPALPAFGWTKYKYKHGASPGYFSRTLLKMFSNENNHWNHKSQARNTKGLRLNQPPVVVPLRWIFFSPRLSLGAWKSELFIAKQERATLSQIPSPSWRRSLCANRFKRKWP